MPMTPEPHAPSCQCNTCFVRSYSATRDQVRADQLRPHHFASVPDGARFRFRHDPDAGPFVKVGHREYVLAEAEVKRIGSRWASVELLPETPAAAAVCLDCGLPYSRFPMDVILPRSQWLEIHPADGGLLCAGCIVARAARLPGAICAHLVIEIASAHVRQPVERANLPRVHAPEAD